MLQQQPTVYGGSSTPPTTQQRVSGTMASRLQYFILPILMVALVSGSLYWLQWSSQRGLALGYPRPTVHILSSSPSSIQDNTSTNFSADATGRNVSYSWDFGDNTGATGVSVSHSFSNIGNFTVTVTVTDAIGQTSSDSSVVNVLPQPPTASFQWQQPYGSGYYYITFDASASQADQNTSIATYNWNFGDGSTDQTSYSGDSHTYSSSGTYTVSLTVTDATGQTGQAYTQSITVS